MTGVFYVNANKVRGLIGGFFSVTLCLSVFLTSCQKEDFEIANLNNNRIIILGHGGMGFHEVYPVNSYESLLSCLASGADGTELDVQMTSDGVLVAYHSENLGKNTNLEGLVNSHTWAELEDAYFVTYPYMRYTITNLDNFFIKVKNRKNFFFAFDCKLYTNDNREMYVSDFSGALIALIEKYNLQDQISIESNDPAFLSRIQEMQPGYMLFYLPNEFEAGLETVQQYNYSGISINCDKISREEVETAHSLGIYVSVWNTPAKEDNVNAVRKNPDFIQTDKVEYLVTLLE